MVETNHSKILWRMTGRAVDDAGDPPLTSSRAVRLAATKAANDTVGLVLTVMGMAEEEQPLDGLLDALGDDLMLVGLQRDGHLAGIIALDVQLRAAVLEMQTVGSLIGAPAEQRPATGTDKTMCDPLLDALLQALPPAMTGTEMDGWIDGCDTGQRIGSARAAGLILKDCDYRILRMTVDLGVANREGLLLIALPPVAQAAVAPPEARLQMDWGAQFRTAVSEAPTALTAHLHRFTIPLARAQSLRVGQVLPLPGCDVHAVRLLSPDGKTVAQAKLGQMGGMRAVRIQPAPPPQMHELAPAARAGGSDSGLLGLQAATTDTHGAEPMMMDDMLLPGDDPPGAGLDDGFAMAPMDLDALSLTD